MYQFTDVGQHLTEICLVYFEVVRKRFVHTTVHCRKLRFEKQNYEYKIIEYSVRNTHKIHITLKEMEGVLKKMEILNW